MKKFFAVLLICLLIVPLVTPLAEANSAKPPDIIIIAKNAPEDVEMEIYHKGRLADVQKQQRFWETYFVFDIYNSKPVEGEESYLLVISGGKEHKFNLDEEQFKSLRTVISFDYKAMTLSSGSLPGRTISLVALRVGLTLLIEGLVFFLFGYREKRSWIIFLLANLATQGYLNLRLSIATIFTGYSIIPLTMMEITILLVEAFVFTSLFKEYSKKRALCFAFVANALSLVLGWIFLAYFPL